MKQKHWRWAVLAVLIMGLSLATILTTRADEYCYIDDIEDEVTSVEVTLTPDPTSGSAPLSVSFTCTAKAVIHYEDKVCITQTEEEGSVENRTPHYKDKSLTPTCPADCTLGVGEHTFTATAEYEEVTGSATVTVTATGHCVQFDHSYTETLHLLLWRSTSTYYYYRGCTIPNCSNNHNRKVLEWRREFYNVLTGEWEETQSGEHWEDVSDGNL